MTPEAEKIARESFRIIESRLSSTPFPEREIVKRVVHATADFDFADLVVFSKNAVEKGIEAIRSGKNVITDVNMVKVGINSRALESYGSVVKCFIDRNDVYALAEDTGKTRAGSAFHLFKNELQDNIVVVGNAPTALFELCRLIEEGNLPAFVIAAPVGFVGARESKEQILEYSTPSIVVKGDRGGSTVAVAIFNALLDLAGKKKE
ncbi:MAG: precorrin-8X methylmutase [Candidatus Hydrothermarchaeales archaeon]